MTTAIPVVKSGRVGIFAFRHGQIAVYLVEGYGVPCPYWRIEGAAGKILLEIGILVFSLACGALDLLEFSSVVA